MGSEFVARKSSVWTKKSDTKPSLFASRPFSVQTRQDNTVNKKELPSEIPPANYITDKMGLNAPQPTVQRQEDNSDKEQEPDLMSKSDESPVADEEEKISPQLEDENQEEKVNLKPAVEEGDEETVSPQLEDENKKEDLQLAADEPEKEDMVSPQLENENKQEDLNKKSIQTKLTVGEPGDKYEQEADTVAAKVVEQINSPKSQQPVQGKVEPVVQPTLMRQGGAGKGTVNRDVEQNIQQARGSGQGLADNVRQPMEQAFGAGFSGVKVHTGGQADVLNRSLNSRAFATGQDIFFKQGEYNPGSRGGQELLAHELTHVVQQTGTVQRQPGKESKGSATATLTKPKAKKTINGSASSISWIDPASPAGKVVSDPAPSATITEGFITGNSGFRFSNYLHGYLTTNDSVTIDNSEFHTNSGIYRDTSFLGLDSEVFPIEQKKKRINKGGIEGIEFDQLVGARTNSPAKIGGAVGAGVGGGVGAWGGAKLGATGGAIFGLPGAVIGGLGGALVGGALGYFAGSATANSLDFSNFPPIWTNIRLTLMADGSQDCQLLEHSIFPSNNFYSNFKLVKKYSALAAKETAWKDSGWGSGNPWGKTRPTWTP